MLKVKIKDLQLAMSYIEKNVYSEYIEFDLNEVGGAALSMSFVDKQTKACKLFLYEASRGITPEVRLTSKLYKPE